MSKKFQTMDGNEAAAYISYAFTEVAGIYPITPSTPLGEHMEKWSSQGKTNLFGTRAKVIEMQSEAGAAGTVHGSLQAGALTTTFTASQGLLLKIPNMYKIAGELLPGVMHVPARSLAAQALSIFGDHQDIYAARQTGWAMLATGSVQEVMDVAGVAHLAALDASVPFMHFYDGFRTSHEIQKVEVMDYANLKSMLKYEKVDAFRSRGLDPNAPRLKGTAQNDDIYFQTREVQNKYYDAIPDIVAGYLDQITEVTGRKYAPFVYYGAEDATDIIISMGSVNETIQETVDYLNAKGQKTGLLKVHLYRPFSKKYFFDALPKSVQRIAVLDRTKEPGSTGEPLFLDVVTMFNGQENAPTIIGGRYGLSSKDTTPGQILAVFKNLTNEQKSPFTIGIVDDVTNLSLPTVTDEEVLDADVTECVFFGLGSDGTVSANKSSIKIIGDETDMYAQGYFAYDSKKAGGVTRSHLRFGPNPIRSTYLVSTPSFVSCSRDTYLRKYDMLSGLRKGGTFLLNTVTKLADIDTLVPNSVKRTLAEKNAKFYIIDAVTLAKTIGLGNRTNTIMQSAFFKLNEQIVSYEQAQTFMKGMAEKAYGKKGSDIVEMNHKAIDLGVQGLVEVPVNPEWINLTDDDVETVDSKFEQAKTDYVKNIVEPINNIKGDDLPVSAFVDYADATYETATTQYEKRNIADFVPLWLDENCIQCNQCAYVCPHAVIRPVLISDDELNEAPIEFPTLDAIGKELAGYKYRIQVSTKDCTGCEVCVTVCPGKKGVKALEMSPVHIELEKKEDVITEYLFHEIEDKSNLVDPKNVKMSQFKKPLFEFSGACAGCGETPYIKLVTQLYGDHMIIANATGCTSIYGGSAPVTPYAVNAEGQGPAWANSLFEDNAEFGFGIKAATDALKDRILLLMEENLEQVDQETKDLFQEWANVRTDFEESKAVSAKIVEKLETIDAQFAKEILKLKSHLVKKSIWMFGGDGWAYDIGYGGLDHVMANRENVNILILDTEVYSNTGGQSSKSSQIGSIAKFTAAGKNAKKKDMAAIAMSYGHVYVAQVSMNANQAQLLKAIKEAEAYDGPSIIICYSPCIEHGIKGGLTNTMNSMKSATECGYWPIFRFNPMLELEGKNPLQIDFKNVDWSKYEDFLLNEKRYSMLKTINPNKYQELLDANKKDAQRRWNNYQRMAVMDYSFAEETTEAVDGE
ncbi:MAG: pyruvate:ferredoxin (flavodoxin) oxidoreductase [Mycoplasmatales bacterium]